MPEPSSDKDHDTFEDRDAYVRVKLRAIVRSHVPVMSDADADALVDILMAHRQRIMDETIAALMYGQPSNAPPVGLLQSTKPKPASQWVYPDIDFTPDPRATQLLHRSFETFAYEVERRTSRATLTRGRPWLAL